MSNSQKIFPKHANYFQQEIFSTNLPLLVKYNLQSGSRVVVKTVEDLDIYVDFVTELCEKYCNFHGHKKAISQLLKISTNRISEWQRIRKGALLFQCIDPVVFKAYNCKTTSLSNLVRVLRHAGWDSRFRRTCSRSSTQDVFPLDNTLGVLQFAREVHHLEYENNNFDSSPQPEILYTSSPLHHVLCDSQDESILNMTTSLSETTSEHTIDIGESSDNQIPIFPEDDVCDISPTDFSPLPDNHMTGSFADYENIIINNDLL